MSSAPITVTLGEDAVVNLYLIYKTSRRPFSLNGATEIEVKIPLASGTLTKLYSLSELTISGVPELGHIQFNLSAAETATLQEGKNQNIFVQTTIAGKKRSFNGLRLLVVSQPSVS